MKKKSLSAIIIFCSFVHLVSQDLTLFRGDKNYPPVEYRENGQLTGFHIELIEASFKAAGITYRIRELPWPRTFDAIRNDEGDGIIFCSINPEREEFLYFYPGAYLTTAKIVAVTRKEDGLEISPGGPVFKGRTGRQTGFFMGPDIEKQFENIIEAPELWQLFQMLQNGKIDCIITNYYEFRFKFIDRPDYSRLSVSATPLYLSRTYLAFNKGRDPDIYRKAAEAIARFRRTEAFHKLRYKYNMPVEK